MSTPDISLGDSQDGSGESSAKNVLKPAPNSNNMISIPKTPKRPITAKSRNFGGYDSDVNVSSTGADSESRKKGLRPRLQLGGYGSGKDGTTDEGSGYDSSLPLSSRERERSRKKEEKAKRKTRAARKREGLDEECADLDEADELSKRNKGSSSDPASDLVDPTVEEMPTPDDDDDDDDEDTPVSTVSAARSAFEKASAAAAAATTASAQGSPLKSSPQVSPKPAPEKLERQVKEGDPGPAPALPPSPEAKVSESQPAAESPVLPVPERLLRDNSGSTESSREEGDLTESSTGISASDTGDKSSPRRKILDPKPADSPSKKKSKRDPNESPAARRLRKEKKKEKKLKRKEKKERKKAEREDSVGTKFDPEASITASAESIPQRSSTDTVLLRPKDLSKVPSARAKADRPKSLGRQITPPLLPDMDGWKSPRRKSATHQRKASSKSKKSKKGRSGYDSEPELGSGFASGFVAKAKGRGRSGSTSFSAYDSEPESAPKKEGNSKGGGSFLKMLRKGNIFSDTGSMSDVEGGRKKRGKRSAFQNDYSSPTRKNSKDHNKEMKKAKKELLKFKKEGKSSPLVPAPSFLDPEKTNLEEQEVSEPRDVVEAEMDVPDVDSDDEDVPVARDLPKVESGTVGATSASSVPPSAQTKSSVLSMIEEIDRTTPKKKGGVLSRFKNRKAVKLEQRRAAARIQGTWRGYILRKKLKASGNKAILLKQATALRQLVSVEAAYTSSLSIIMDSYLNPLKDFSKNNEEARKSLPLQVVDAIFRNVDQIHSLHSNFLSDLNRCLGTWPFSYQEVPTLLLRLAGMMTIYIPYAEEAPSAEETLRFYKQKPPLSTFLAKTYNERRHSANLPPRAQIPDLGALLATPYKHIGKDWSACASFFNCTPPEAADYFVMADAVAIMSQLRRYVWHIVEEGISKRKMTILSTKIQSTKHVAKPSQKKTRSIELNRRASLRSHDVKLIRGMAVKKGKKAIFASDVAEGGGSPAKVQIAEVRKKEKEEETSGVDGPFKLYAPQRKLVRNGSLFVDDKKRHVFLFNDVCLILEVVSAHSSKFESVFELEGAKMHSKSVSIEQNVQSFHIKDIKDGDFTFTEPLSCDNNEPSWMQSFEDLIAFTTDKIFSANLEQVVERESSAIPSLVHNIIQSLNKNITRPGLFQTPCNPKTVQALRDPAAHRKLNNCSPHDVIGLLIMYLEQLPDNIILFDSKDPIFTASNAPSEEALLEWVRNTVEGMPMHAKNLLEYLVSFLAKVLGRSSSNGVTSMDLAVIFGPLLVSPKDLSLEYCYKMPRVIRLVQTIIEKAGELFRTADNDSNPLPKSLDEFFGADQFGQWWRDFRQKKPYFIGYITEPAAIDRLVKFIINIPEVEDSEDGKARTQFASLAYGVLVNDGVVQVLFENSQLLDSVFKHFNGQDISERANKHFCDFVEVLLRGNPKAMVDYLVRNKEMNKNVIASIGSGNFCNMVLSVSETWQMNDDIHRIVTGWGALALYQFLLATESYLSDVLPNTVRFLRFLVRSTAFMGHELSGEFSSLLCNREFMQKIIEKTLHSDKETCVCVIPFLIELLVQNKNKTPMQQTRPLLSIPKTRADGSPLSPEEQAAAERRVEGQRQRLAAEVPLVVQCLLERHRQVVKLMRETNAEPEVGQTKPPLGFFRFGLVKLVQAVLVTNYPYGNYLIARTELVSACLGLFFEYYTHSILHAVIAYIVRYIMAMGNLDLVELVIRKQRLPCRIVEVFERGDSDPVLENLRGYLKMLAIAIRNNPFAEELLSGEQKWGSFVSDVLLREEPKSSTNTAELALARKRMAGKPRALTDQVEDKIA